MERKHLHGIPLLGGLAMALLCGCIRDELEPCPPLRLSLEVADKNYVNSAAAARLGYEEERPEDLPFREYVSDLAYRVSDLETGRVVAERALSPVEGDAGSVEVPLPADLPYGSYVLTAWGNLGDTAAFDSDLASLGLHPGGAEGSDAYFTRDTLVYALDSERFSCGMRRLKGKLILATERMPEAYAFSEWKVSDIMSRFSAEGGYREPTTLAFDRSWEREEPAMVAKSLLAPSRLRGDPVAALRGPVAHVVAQINLRRAPFPGGGQQDRPGAGLRDDEPQRADHLALRVRPLLLPFQDLHLDKRQLGDPAYHGCGITLFIDKTEV